MVDRVAWKEVDGKNEDRMKRIYRMCDLAASTGAKRVEKILRVLMIHFPS